MRNALLIAILTLSKLASAQIPTGTDIFLSDCKLEKGNLTVQIPVNITHREGYDNQPYFSEDGLYIFYVAIKEDKQSDIYFYSIPKKSTTRITNSRESEYSPIITSNEQYIDMVRVEKDSTQRFAHYSFENFTTSLVCPQLDSIGYYNLLNDSTFVFFKITEVPTLWLSDTKSCNEKFLASKVGRCIYPKAENEIYFTQLIDSVRWISSLQLKSGKTEKIVACLKGSEDFTVYDSNTFILGNGSKLYKFNPRKNKTWIEFADFQAQGISAIKRISISKDATHLVFVNDSGNP